MSSEHSTARHLPTETQFLCAALEPGSGPSQNERLRVLGREIRDWPELFTRAQEHRVLSPLVQIMKTAGIPNLPTLWQEYVQTELANRTYESLVLTQELARLAECFEERGVTAVPYKGPLLAILCGKSVSSRQYENLDFLVKQSDWTAADAVLREGGYQALHELDPADRSEKRTHVGGYRRADISVVVQLQALEMLPYLPRRLDWEDLTKRLVQVSVGGTAVRTISREGVVSLIAAQATRHCWSRLQWTLDVARLITSPEGFDWAELLERARDRGVERMVLLGLGLAANLFQTALPEDVVERIARDSRLKKQQEFVLGMIAEGAHAEAEAGWMRRALYWVRSCDNASDGLRYAARVAGGAEKGWSMRGSRPRKDLGGFLPTPEPVVEKLLELAEPREGDVLYDLGCGDGRVVIAAAKRYGIRCVGVDLDPQLLARARERARREGVEHLVRLIRQDAKSANVSKATIVHLFVSTLGNVLLRPYLEEQLKPGTRIVSANAQMLGWPVEKRAVVSEPGGMPWTVFLMRAGSPEASEHPSTASATCARS